MEIENCFGKPDDKEFHINKQTKIFTSNNWPRAQNRDYFHSMCYFPAWIPWALNQEAKRTVGPPCSFRGNRGTQCPAQEWESPLCPWLAEWLWTSDFTSWRLNLPCKNEKVTLHTWSVRKTLYLLKNKRPNGYVKNTRKTKQPPGISHFRPQMCFIKVVYKHQISLKYIRRIPCQILGDGRPFE